MDYHQVIEYPAALMKLAVVSTGHDVWRWKEQHMASIKGQSVRPLTHYYIDDLNAAGCALENIYRFVHTMSPDTIVCLVDADDWLAHPDSLLRVARAYHEGAWLTHGQFVTWPKKMRGFAAPYPADAKFRHLPWWATHLKTFRAGLFQKIPVEALKRDGAWIRHAADQAIMFPMLEMAQQITFIPDVLYTFNVSNPRSFHNAPAGGGPGTPEWEGSVYVRGEPAFTRLADRPW